MKTRVWLLIQENSTPEHGQLNRHYWFANYLKRKGFEPVVFAASKARNSNEQLITDNASYMVDDSHGFPYVYIKVNNYGNNMRKRLWAIMEYHTLLLRYAGTFAHRFGEPDVILGSSNYPITPTLANWLAKHFGAKSICEIRDLWPLSLEEYEIIPRGGIIAKLMYKLEKRNYTNADAIVFTMEGGKQYILDKHWDTAHGGSIDVDKVWHINNGVDLDSFRRNETSFLYDNEEYLSCENARVVYTGSIRKANNVGFLVDVADCLRDDHIDLFIFGEGGEEAELREDAKRRGIGNIHFMGHVDKRYIPSILSHGVLMLMMYSPSQRGISRYGMSQNKLFDYLASGHPVISNLPNQYSVVNRHECGVEEWFDTPDQCANAIRIALKDETQLQMWEENARETAQLYSFDSLTDRLINVINSISSERKAQ